jgi:hypothetical protein
MQMNAVFISVKKVLEITRYKIGGSVVKWLLQYMVLLVPISRWHEEYKFLRLPISWGYKGGLERPTDICEFPLTAR